MEFETEFRNYEQSLREGVGLSREASVSHSVPEHRCSVNRREAVLVLRIDGSGVLR